MSETIPEAPAAPAHMEKPSAKKRGKKSTGANHKPPMPSVSTLVTEALLGSQRGGMSLAALKKALSASGYYIVKNNGSIKQGPKSLVNKGILVQTKGTGASGSFKLNKNPSQPTRGKVKPASSKTKKALLAGDSKPKKDGKNKKAKKPRAVARSGRKAKSVKLQQQRKGPSKGQNREA